MKKLLIVLSLLLASSTAYADTLNCDTRTNIVAGNSAAAADVKTCMDNLVTWTTAITDTNIKTGAAIDIAKVSGTAVNLSDTQTITGTKTFGDAVTDGLTFVSAIQGANPFILDGATDDTATVTIAIYDEGTSVTYGISDMAENGSFIMSTLDNTAGDLDDANAVWGVSNGLRMEGATANDFETTVSPADVTADRTLTLADEAMDLEEQLIKAWVEFNGTDGSTYDSYNSTSVTRVGLGDYTWTIATDFSSANYAVVCMSQTQTSGSAERTLNVDEGGLAAGTVALDCVDNANNHQDEELNSCIAIGN